MTNPISICNQALAAMGSRSTIASLTERSKEAMECNRFYAQTRDELLSSALWNFARATQALALLKTRSTSADWSASEPAMPWLYSYAYPTDCLRVRYLYPAGQYGVNPANPGIWPITAGLYSGQWASPWIPRHAGYDAYFCNNPPYPFAVTGDQDSGGADIRVIATDLEYAVLIFTRRIENPNVWDTLFQSALVAKLAAKLAIPLSGDKDMLKLNTQLAIEAIDEAKTRDGNEGMTIMPAPEPDWICARG